MTKTIKLQTQSTSIRTWNALTPYACSRIQELTHKLKCYCWYDIIGLSEVRWTGSGETSTEDGHKIWFSGEEKKHQHGVAFIVRKEITGSVISCMPISSRLISICVSAKPHNMTIIQVYAPTTDHDDEEVEKFYELLESIITEVPKKDILIVQGDWNAKVGPDTYENWAGTVGRSGISETNNRGLRLLEFARGHCLALANTLHPTSCLELQFGTQIMGKFTIKLTSFWLHNASSPASIRQKQGHSLVLTSAVIMTS